MPFSRVASLFITPVAKSESSDNEASTRSPVSSLVTSPFVKNLVASPSAVKGSRGRETTASTCGASEISTDGEFLDCDSSDAEGDSTACHSRVSGSESDGSDFEAVSEVADSQHPSRASTTYPIAVLLQLRDCGTSSDTLRYGTQPRIGTAERRDIPALVPEKPSTFLEKVQEQRTRIAMTDASVVSWSVVQQQRRVQHTTGPNNTLSSKDFGRKVRGVLNKLTVERFDVLSEQLANLGASTPHHVAIMVREIFEIATTQHKFIFMYADLCHRLESDSRIVRATLTGPNSKSVSFRRILLDQCQNSFEEMLTGNHEWGDECRESADVEEVRVRCKQRALGNIKLTARLLVLDMLTSKLLITLCEALIDSFPSCTDALECLAALLTIAGPQFDSATWLSHAAFQAIFARIQEMISDKSIPPRLRFLLRDVLELRAAGWVDQKQATIQSKGPMKLHDVRKEANSRPSFCANISAPSKPAREAGALVRETSAKLDQHSGEVRLSAFLHAHQKESPKASCPCVPVHLVAALEAAIKSASTAAETSSYNRADFHRELWCTLRELAKDGDSMQALLRIQAQHVPHADQANEFMDLITRAVEEPDRSTRQKYFGLAASIADAEIFIRSACLEGIEGFFLDVFDDLCDEIQDLAGIVSHELCPALQCTLTQSELFAVVPPVLRT